MNQEALDAAVTAAEQRLATAQRERAKAEAVRDRALADEARVREHLRVTFGVTSVAEAQTMLTVLNEQLTDHVAELTAALDEAETP